MNNKYVCFKRKKILGKNFVKNRFNKNNLWSYMDRFDFGRQITFKWDKKNEKYCFSFPMNKSKYNYVTYFDTHREAEEYVKFILNEYLDSN